MSRLAVEILNEYTGAGIIIREEETEVDVSRGWREVREEDIKYGLSQGLSQGLEQGKLRTYIFLVKNGDLRKEVAIERLGISEEAFEAAMKMKYEDFVSDQNLKDRNGEDAWLKSIFASLHTRWKNKKS